MSNEAWDTLERYFNSPPTFVRYCGSNYLAEEVIGYLSSGKLYAGDSPDMAILLENKCLAIEHFEFDCYKNARRGSEYKKEEARIKRVFSTSPDDSQDHEVIRGKSSYEQYINNVKAIFSEHYTKINNYKQNLIKYGLINTDTPLKIAFLIEDVSPLGSSVESKHGMEPIILALSKEFLDILRKSPDVDYIITCSSVNSNKYIWLIFQNELDKYIQKSVDYANMNFIDFTPHVMSFKITIPSDCTPFAQGSD